MASERELRAIAAFIKRVNYIYTQSEELQNLGYNLKERYINIIEGNDNIISAAAWNAAIGTSNNMTVSGNAVGAAELAIEISGWGGTYQLGQI